MKKYVFTFLILFECRHTIAQTQIGSSPIYYLNGNVGIGTTTPETPLEILVPATATERPFKVSVSDAPSDFFDIRNGTGVSGQFIPTLRAYHVTDNRTVFTIMAEINAEMDNSANALMSFNSRLSTGVIQTRPLFKWVNYDETKMTMLANGNLGIGTESPIVPLTVQGIIRSQLSSSNFVNNYWVGSDGNCYMNYVGGASSSRIGFQIDNQSKAIIYKNGDFVVHSSNVGIGFNNPKYKLAVNGTISAKEVKVSTTPNSDYVFEPDYPLLPLSEVETHIKEKKHLPGIPSAEEFKQNGVGLGEMDDMLLRKVEELTLYLIEQKGNSAQLLKKLEELQQENELQSELIQQQFELIKKIQATAER